ncbi:SixA phosphatase family protein [Mesonia ostreae]|uniref:Histidine phosphatase family protein n=1 Tax=Mesonia ostreae TaxID=861110 RepID=A0ABU2KKB7_9FLAO|nr:histidine phosphatase family protein [Mesonia ostreae]MDT0295156.1 histidine phosphatase family protein [Mesonia ostreae]
MKTLILVRHGKSSWKEDLPDHERPLKKRAFNDADLVIKAFKLQNNYEPCVFSSSAVRALTTAKLFKEALKIEDDKFSVKKELYTFEEGELLNFVRNADDSIQNLMLFGHNPAMTNLTNQLGDDMINNLPTTGLVVLQFEIDSWKDINSGKTLVKLFPKMFR